MVKIYHNLSSKKKDSYLKKLINRGLIIGNNVDIVDSYFFDPSHCFLISIGDNCTICPNVRLIAHDASTKKILGYTKIGKIAIGANCFLGDSVIVMPNVQIGSNSVIGAGSVVTKHIPPNSIAAGNPARVISTTDDYIKKITNISKNKKIFTGDYLVENLNAHKRKEMFRSIGDSIGFII